MPGDDYTDDLGVDDALTAYGLGEAARGIIQGAKPTPPTPGAQPPAPPTPTPRPTPPPAPPRHRPGPISLAQLIAKLHAARITLMSGALGLGGGRITAGGLNVPMQLGSATFPTAHFACPGAYTDIPQATVTLQCEAGQAIVLAHCKIDGQGGISATVAFQLLKDGVAVHTDWLSTTNQAGGFTIVSVMFLTATTAGSHTWKLQTKQVAGSNRIVNEIGRLIVLNIPSSLIA